MTDMEDGVDEQPVPAPQSRLRHINKRALKNKSLSVSFDEKDLKDYVTGFHKRKKKRRKEARQKQEEALRRKRIEERKKRKLERAMVYGVDSLATGSGSDGSEKEQELEDEDTEPHASISGTTTYDHGDMKVMVTTSEISRDEEIDPSEKILQAPLCQSNVARKKQSVPVNKKKTFKRVAKHKSKSKSLNKRDKKKGKNNMKFR